MQRARTQQFLVSDGIAVARTGPITAIRRFGAKGSTPSFLRSTIPSPASLRLNERIASVSSVLLGASAPKTMPGESLANRCANTSKFLTLLSRSESKIFWQDNEWLIKRDVRHRGGPK